MGVAYKVVKSSVGESSYGTVAECAEEMYVWVCSGDQVMKSEEEGKNLARKQTRAFSHNNAVLVFSFTGTRDAVILTATEHGPRCTSTRLRSWCAF
jgi:hypothetical protein